ncbi:MAG: hypothetical protein QN716_12650, partial [Nitrososphaeraceae archaeon]|nr:hypothetical protein [Nitrososphaeraceae archaeon]
MTHPTSYFLVYSFFSSRIPKKQNFRRGPDSNPGPPDLHANALPLSQAPSRRREQKRTHISRKAKICPRPPDLQTDVLPLPRG